jgi:hypothetical protein
MKKMRKFAEGGYSDSDMEAKAANKYRAMVESMMEKTPKLPGEDIERADVNPVTKKIKEVGKYVTGMAMPGMPGAVGRAVRGMKKGGKVKHDDMKQDMPMMAKVAAKAVKGHEKRMHKMAGGGVTRADGCVSKGHTKGKMVKMANGGAC